MRLVRCFKLRLLLKPFWGLSWGPVGGLLGSQEGPGRGSWRLLGPAWGHLGPSWPPLPRFGPFRAPKRAPREANLSPFGDILGPQEASKRPFGVNLGSKEALWGSCEILCHRNAQEVPHGLLQASLGSTFREPPWRISEAVSRTLWSNLGTSAPGL